MTGLSLIAGRRGVYHVFAPLTRGEATSHCAGRGLQPQHESGIFARAETPTGFGAVGNDICKAHRPDSWHSWLDARATSTPGPGTATQMQGFRLTHRERGPGTTRDAPTGRYVPAPHGSPSTRMIVCCYVPVFGVRAR